MKNYLVDLPVRIRVWSRPEMQKKQFDIIKEARPSVLFLVSDGPREHIDGEKELIEESRRIVEDINWDCNVHKIYFEKNEGMYESGRVSSDIIWKIVDRCLFLEDDIIPSVSYFRFCAELLEKYKNDLRVQYITGVNYLGNYKAPSADYFFSSEGCIWGIATWKRTHEQRTRIDDSLKDQYFLDKTCEKAKKHKPGFERKIKGYSENKKFEGHVPGMEFYKGLYVYGQHQLFIVPKKNMISNIGLDELSAHAPSKLKLLSRAEQKLFYMKTYECEFPLKHPTYIIDDEYYYRNVKKIRAIGQPVRRACRNIERGIRYIIYGEHKRLLRRMGLNLRIIRNNER